MANANRTIFADWFASEVLVADNETCSDSLMLYVGSKAKVEYRDQYESRPKVPYGFDISKASSFSGVPDFVVPSKQHLSKG